jgi:hypothetical protein
MSARQASTYFSEILARLREFLREESAERLVARTGALPPLTRAERAKVKDLVGDVRRLDGDPLFPVTPGLGHVFWAFERLFSVRTRRPRLLRNLPALDDEARVRAKPLRFAVDYATFDRLSIIYGGLFRGAVIANYLLGVIAVGLTLASMLPQPRFLASSGASLFPEFAHYALRIGLSCIVIIAGIFYYGQTPHDETVTAPSRWSYRGLVRRIAHRWHERWLEYRLLAERFRYLELMLSISPTAAMQAPFTPADCNSERWYDRYFVWRTESAKPAVVTLREFHKRALASMLDQIQHHDANHSRRGAIARRLHKIAVALFFSSLVLCLIDLAAESCTASCFAYALTGPFRDNFKSLVLFGAILAPTLSAAIHGILATTEYTKVAESSSETADRIVLLVKTICDFSPGEGLAGPETLEPIRDAVTAFADAAVNEASGWHAMLHDKNVPLV